MTAKRSNTRWMAGCALVLAALVVAVALGEIALRVLEIGYPLLHERHATRGIAGIPKVSGWYLNEGRSYVRFNSAGFNDREYPVAKPPGTVRIAVLGDSFVDAKEVPLEKSFRMVAEQRLASCSALRGRRIEIMNFGSGGYGTVQGLQTFRHEARRYQPDLVLQTVFYGNDLHDNHPVFGKGNLPRPYLKRDPSGAWTVGLSFDAHETWLHKTLRAVINRSRVLQLLNEARRRTIIGFDDRAAGAAGPGSSLESSFPYRPPQTAMEHEAWEMTEAALEIEHQEVRAEGAAFWVMAFANGMTVGPDRRRESPADYPDRRLETFAAARGITLFSLNAALRAEADATGTYLYGFANARLGEGHWNEAGHRFVGTILADKLCREFLVR